MVDPTGLVLAIAVLLIGTLIFWLGAVMIAGTPAAPGQAILGRIALIVGAALLIASIYLFATTGVIFG